MPSSIDGAAAHPHAGKVARQGASHASNALFEALAMPVYTVSLQQLVACATTTQSASTEHARNESGTVAETHVAESTESDGESDGTSADPSDPPSLRVGTSMVLRVEHAAHAEDAEDMRARRISVRRRVVIARG